MSRVIYAVVDDMFFAAKIRATAEALGVEVFFLSSAHALLEKVAEDRPDLIVVDLHNTKVNAVELAPKLKTAEGFHDVPLLGFFSHVEAELQRKALAAGFDRLLPRSVFSRDLGEILAG